MHALTITKQQANRFLLAHQGLAMRGQFAGKQGVLDYIRHVGCIQFDPLNIVGTNPELVLQARIGDFRSGMLAELLYRERKLLDGLDKVMSIYPVEDWPYFSRFRRSAQERLEGSTEISSIVPLVRREIEERGPLSSLDLKMEQVVDWSWGPTRLARAALASMYSSGELVVHHKINTRKVYDSAARHLSRELLTDPDPNQTGEEYHDWHVLRRIGGVGLLWDKPSDAWLGIRGLKSKERRAALGRLLEQGRVMELSVDDVATPLYMRTADRAVLEKASQARDEPPGAAVLAPLDNLLWDRRLVEELFGFSYRWEVYKPAAERRYGYYVLPVLHGNRFVARFEPGRDRHSGMLVIKQWWWEPGVVQSERLHQDLRSCFEQFLAYLGADSLVVDPAAVRQAGLRWFQPESWT